VATGSDDRTVRLWETAGRFDPVIPVPAGARAAAWSRDGTAVAVASGESVIEIHDGGTFAPQRRISLDVQAIHDVAFDPQTGALFAACSDGIVARTESGSRDETTSHRIHKHAVYSVDVSPDGARLATASDDGTFTIRDPATLESVLKDENRHSRRVWCARFAPDGEQLYTAGDDRRAVAWDVATGKERMVFAGHEAAVKWLAVAVDGRQLATASADGTVGIWRAATGQLVHRLRGPGCTVMRVAFAPDGTRVVAVASDGSAHLWDAASGRSLPVLRGSGGQSHALAISPDGHAVAIAAGDTTLRVEGLSAADIFRRFALSPLSR
jgi:WD40 repeat protein